MDRWIDGSMELETAESRLGAASTTVATWHGQRREPGEPSNTGTLIISVSSHHTSSCLF